MGEKRPIFGKIYRNQNPPILTRRPGTVPIWPRRIPENQYGTFGVNDRQGVVWILVALFPCGNDQPWPNVWRTGLDRTATATTMGGREVLVLPAASVNLKLDQADPFLRYWIEYLMERVVDLSSRID